MTTNKRLRVLKNELKEVKKFLDKNPEKCYHDYNNGNAMYYKIVMNNGIEYIIGRTTFSFPDINFKNIIYICKQMKYSYHYYDNFKGDFDISTDYSYFQNLYKRIGVIETIATGKEY